jgi:hypothetical protein
MRRAPPLVFEGEIDAAKMGRRASSGWSSAGPHRILKLHIKQIKDEKFFRRYISAATVVKYFTRVSRDAIWWLDTFRQVNPVTDNFG